MFWSLFILLTHHASLVPILPKDSLTLPKVRGILVALLKTLQWPPFSLRIKSGGIMYLLSVSTFYSFPTAIHH